RDLLTRIEFFTGAPLILLTRRLARDLDGIYHRGEIYLRWLQRLSSLFFGNPVGRAVTLYLLLPLLGAFFIIKGTNVLMEEAHKFLGWPRYHPYADVVDGYESGELPGPPKSLYHRAPEIGDLHSAFRVEEHSFDLGCYVVVAVFLLLLLHWRAVRLAGFWGLRKIWVGPYALFHHLPPRLPGLGFGRGVLRSRPYLIFWAFVAKPVLAALPLAALLWYVGVPWDWLAIYTGSLALLLSVAMNTRMGLRAQEAVADWGVRSTRRIREDL